jgi:hypothetical protein
VFKLAVRQLVVVILCNLMMNPAVFVAAANDVTPRSVVGSITSRGSVRVSEVLMPGEATIFSGDRVQTANGTATIQHKGGARIFLGSDTSANFALIQVGLNHGLMSFQTVSTGVVFAASTLRLQPATAKTAANVTMQDRKASVAVTEGTLRIMDPSGVQLASLNAGEARLFEEAPNIPASASAPAAPPQNGGNGSRASDGNRKWLISLGAAVVGASLGVAGLVHANDANSRADSQAALVTQISSQNAALSTQVTALRAQAAALQAFANAVSSASAQQQVLIQQLAAAVADLATLEAQLATVQQQTSALLSAIASQGGVATPAQLSQLQSLSAQQANLNGRLQTTTNTINTVNNNLRNSSPPPTLSPTRAS